MQLLETKQLTKSYEHTAFINPLVYSTDLTTNLVLVEAKVFMFQLTDLTL